jgi:hypothetical protein
LNCKTRARPDSACYKSGVFRTKDNNSRHATREICDVFQLMHSNETKAVLRVGSGDRRAKHKCGTIGRESGNRGKVKKWICEINKQRRESAG